MLPFQDRAEAGRLLAVECRRRVSASDCVMLALPRGGVPVAFEIATHLHAPLDVLFVKKVGVPWQPELAVAAVASNGISIIDQQVLEASELPEFLVKKLICKKQQELETAQSAFRARYPALPLTGRSVIVVDDGAATGSTMLAALRCAREQEPRELVVAVPVASEEAAERFRLAADQVVCLACPQPFIAVGRYYNAFPQVGDEELEQLLAQSGRAEMKADAFVSAVNSES